MSGWPKYKEVVRERDQFKRERDELRDALTHILELGRKDVTNSKYDGYFETARKAIERAQGDAT